MTILAALAWLGLAGCTSPEATRKRGGGAGADPGNHASSIDVHGKIDMFHGTPHKIAKK